MARTSSLTCSTPPSSMSACLRASGCESPCFIFSWVSSSTADFSSSSSACSIARLQKVSEETGNSAWHDASYPNSGGFDRRCHDLDDLTPIPFLGPELCAAGGSQAVVLGPAIVFRGAPFGLDPTLLFHAVQSRKERAKTHLKGTGTNLRDPSRHTDSMQWFQCQRFQDQQA